MMVANYAHLEKRINIAIGMQAPCEYFQTALKACRSRAQYFGNIYDETELAKNIADNCIPEEVFGMDASQYQEFLAKRRALIAAKIKEYFVCL